MDNELLCNFKKCRRALSSLAWVTSCSHIFCYDDGLREFGKEFVCPACDAALSGKYDIVKIDLNPTEQYKSMVLAGQRPEIVFEICSRAISFWTYQVHQEITFQEYASTKIKERSFQLEKYYENLFSKTRSELENVKQQLEGTRHELEASKRKAAELAEKLKERIRQHEKLQHLYEALRRKFISPSFFEKQSHGEQLVKRTQDPFVISTASEIIHQGEKKSGKKKQYHARVEKEFILKPAPTPTEDKGQTMWNFSSTQECFDNIERNIHP